MLWFGKSRVGTEKYEEPKVIPPLLIFSKADYDYSVGPNVFRNFTYTFDVNLHGKPEERVQQSRESVETIVNLLDSLYSNEKGFKRGQKGNLSSDSRKIEISYYTSDSFMPSNVASVHFNAHYEAEKIARAHSLLFLYGANQEDLLLTHDTIVALPGVLKTPSTLRSLEQIEMIRKGCGPTVQNFLLN